MNIRDDIIIVYTDRGDTGHVTVTELATGNYKVWRCGALWCFGIAMLEREVFKANLVVNKPMCRGTIKEKG